MKKFLMTLIVTLAFCGSIFAQHPETHWPGFDYGPYEQQGALYASIMINGEPVDINYANWEQMEIAAYVGDAENPEWRMVGMFLTDEYVIDWGELFPTTNGEPIFYTTPGDQVFFMMYDHATGTEYTECHPIIWDGDGSEVTILTGEEHWEGFDDPDHPLMLNFIGGTTPPTPQTFTKHINGYGDATDKSGYYLIASPVNGVDPTTVEGMTYPQGDDYANFDLYYFNEATDGEEWCNYKQGAFNLAAGTGYLYANKNNVDLSVTGTPADGDSFDVTLHKTGTGAMAGVNLVGNPFGVAAHIDRPGYTMNGDGYALINAGEDIGLMQGILVDASEDGEVLTITKANTSKSPNLSLNVTSESKLVDRAIVNFGNGRNLGKITFRENDTKLYMTQDNKDYAVLYSEEQGEMPVCFKAEKNGSYNISFNAENTEFAYLHLIDNLTGNDVDLLENPTYSFDAQTTDYASRFRLVFASGNSNSQFAFLSNGEIILSGINGNTNVQLFDVTGRLVSSLNGVSRISTENMAAGVYMIQLVNGENSLTQKIVVK